MLSAALLGVLLIPPVDRRGSTTSASV